MERSSLLPLRSYERLGRGDSLFGETSRLGRSPRLGETSRLGRASSAGVTPRRFGSTLRLGRRSSRGVSTSRAGRDVVGRAVSGLETRPSVTGRVSRPVPVFGVTGRAVPARSPTPTGDFVLGSTRPLLRFCNSIMGTPFVVGVRRPFVCPVVGELLTKRA